MYSLALMASVNSYSKLLHKPFNWQSKFKLWQHLFCKADLIFQFYVLVQLSVFANDIQWICTPNCYINVSNWHSMVKVVTALFCKADIYEFNFILLYSCCLWHSANSCSSPNWCPWTSQTDSPSSKLSQHFLCKADILFQFYVHFWHAAILYCKFAK